MLGNERYVRTAQKSHPLSSQSDMCVPVMCVCVSVCVRVCVELFRCVVNVVMLRWIKLEDRGSVQVKSPERASGRVVDGVFLLPLYSRTVWCFSSFCFFTICHVRLFAHSWGQLVANALVIIPRLTFLDISMRTSAHEIELKLTVFTS